MRRIRRWGAFGVLCAIGGLAGWEASAAPARRSDGGFATARPVGTSWRGAGGFLPVRHAFDRGRPGGFGSIDYQAAHSRYRRGDEYRRRTFVSGGYWPPYDDPLLYGDPGDGGPAAAVTLDQGQLEDPTVLDLPARPGIRAAPAAEPALFTVDREALRGPRRTGAKILSRGRDGRFAVVEGSGEAGRGAADSKIIQIGAPTRR